MKSYGSIKASSVDDFDNGEELTSLLPNGKTIKFQNEDRASIWSKLRFSWMEPLLVLGNEKRKLDPDDLRHLPLPKDTQSEPLSNTFDEAWNDELSKSKTSGGHCDPSLIKTLFKAFGFEFMTMVPILKLVHDTCVFVAPQVLNKMIVYLGSDQYPLSYGLWLTAVVTLSQLVMSFCLRHYFFKCYKFGLQIRTAVMIAVYKKALVLSGGERQNRSLGEITNLMSIDAQRLQDLVTYLHAIWYSFYQILFALFLLWKQLGPSALAGLFIICIMIPVTKTIAKYMGTLQQHVMASKDKRVDVNSEVLGAMKVVKLQAWEEPFIDRITKLRETELSNLLTYIIAQCGSLVIWTACPLLVSLSTFAAYVYLGNELDVATALTSVALFDILRFPLFMLPQMINRIVEAGVSLQRLQSFLICEEHIPVLEGKLQEIGQVRMSNVTCAYESMKALLGTSKDGSEDEKKNIELAGKNWEISLLKCQLEEAEHKIKELSTTGNRTNNDESKNKEAEIAPTNDSESSECLSSKLCLKRIDFECKPGNLIALIGGVGAGKSTMLNGILGEVRRLSGTTEVKGKLAFFAQTPFILNATVRANILFSHVNEPIDEARYQRAIECCALKHDLKMLPAGDQTEIGEKGITLSGGQKARVALARVVYHRAEISLIDDALSAVDAHVAKHLFNECIVNNLLKPEDNSSSKRSVILATNALQHLNHPRVDKIVVLREGRIVEQGSYKELSEDKSSEFSRYLKVINETSVNSSIVDENVEDETSGIEDGNFENSIRKSERSERSESNSKLMTVEERLVGHVGIDVYLYWARAAGTQWIPLILLVVFGAVEFINFLSKWWLTYWSSHGSEHSQTFFLGLYGLLNFSIVLAIFFRLLFIMLLGLRASRKIYDNLLNVIMAAPQSWFDVNPLGRIINRFSQDIYTVDSQLMTSTRSYLTTILSVVSALVVNSGVSPAFTIGIIPLIYFYAKQQQFFTVTYRELKRLDSVGRSPIYALLGETIDGVATIRAHTAEQSLLLRLKNMLNIQQNAFYLLFVAQCWLAIRLELVGTLLITLSCLLAVLQHQFLDVDPKFAGIAGLAISYAMSITQSLNWSVRMASDLEASMISVERIRSYCQVESEASRETQGDKSLPKNWPSCGNISFSNASLRYRPGLPRVLRSLNINIPEGSKVGVVGRTGAGKSTLMVSLLRIVELDSGQIIIDGHDIRNVGLNKLRSGIAVIPQDPVLFSGDIRSNLDPFDQYEDSDLSSVLVRVGLSSDVKPSTSTSSLSSLSVSQGLSLKDPVKEGGANFSVGQRQLLVIARALLSGSRIVIMDEATAAVDADTDARIQMVMRKEFRDSTCITIAHRINTIMDSDFILVMDNGKAVEFDTPQKLLSNGGMFRDLVHASTHVS